VAPPQGRLVFGNPAVASRPDTFRYVYRTLREAQSYLSEIAEQVRGQKNYRLMADIAAITQVGSQSVPGVALQDNTRQMADPRWVNSMAHRQKVIEAADEAGLTPVEWVRRGGFVGPRSSPRWRIIEDALTRNKWYALFVARSYERGSRGGMSRVSGRNRPRRYR
jgi:hypothetical protein